MKKCGKIAGILLFVLLVLALVTSFLVPVLSKYVHQVTAYYGGEETINYTVNSVFEVRTQEELFAAINQGYTYIQLSKDIENPLIVTQKAENLDSDLILDLNGIEIQRNGYEPILNISEDVRLTVVDTSEEQTGGLYNPVGSVFNINGGILTVVTGSFESGPRFSEYYSYNTGVLNSDEGSATKRTVVEANAQTVTMYQKSGSTFTQSTMTAPIIKSYPTVTGDIVYNHGNLYFDEAVTKGDWQIKADTYCYYRTSEDATVVNTAAMADWYYTYWVTAEEFNYYKAALDPTDNVDDYVEITIFGYERTIAGAAAKTTPSEYYAAIQMHSGTLEVQKGGFYSYFGVDTTACVNASGGSIVVGEGKFSSRIPNASGYVAGGVHVKETDSAAFGSAYFNNYTWYTKSFNAADPAATPGMLARQGGGYCILNSGDATVSVGRGDFYSSNNNIIKMTNGALTVSGGSFTKNNTIALGGNASNDAAIFMENGELKVQNTSYNVVGDYNRAIHMKNGKLQVMNSSYTVSGSYTHGIYSTVSGSGNFIVGETSFALTGGKNQTGIYAENGEVYVAASTKATITADGINAKGVHANGGLVVSYNYFYDLKAESSTGIHSEGGKVSVYGGEIKLHSNKDCYGVYAVSPNADTELSVLAQNTTIDVGYDSANEKSSGTHNASVGVYLASAKPSNTVTLNGAHVKSYEVGVALSGGKLDVKGTGSILTKRASAIAVAGGNLTFDTGSNYTVTSYNTTSEAASNLYNLSLPILNGGVLSDVLYRNTDGIYVQGGSLTSNGTINLTHTGLQNVTDIANYNYTSLVVTSYAIRVEGGSVSMLEGTVTANAGGGICCSGGNITMGAENGANNITISTKGVKKSAELYNALGGSLSLGSWQSYKSINGGHAIELNGGNIEIYGGSYEAAFGNGVAANGSGEITIHDGVFHGWMTDLPSKTGPSAFYGLKVIGGATVNIFNGVFDGGNGGAFVTGIDTVVLGTDTDGNTVVESIDGNYAKVFVYAGSFGSVDANGVAKNGDGFNVYDMAKVVFGAYPADHFSTAAEYKKQIKIHAKWWAIAANNISATSSLFKESYVYVYYGDCFGAYNTGVADIKVYNIGTEYNTWSSNYGQYSNEGNGFYPTGYEN